MREAVVRLGDGRRVGYAEYGDPDGWPILMFHGLPGGRFYGLDDRALRDEQARLLSVERPGIGYSDRLADRALNDWPSDVVGFADALGVERFAVVGTSAGAPFAFATAAALGDRVSAVALRSGLGPAFAHPEFDDGLSEAVRPLLPFARADHATASALAHEVLAADSARWRNDPDAFFEQWLSGWPENDRGSFLAQRVLWLRVLEATYSIEGGFADDIMCSYAPWDFRIDSIRAPVRGFHGTRDQVAPLGLIEIAVKEAGGDVVPYEGEGHYLAADHDIDTVRFCTRP